MTEPQKLGIELRELEFGESLVYDYYKYGKLLKKKMYEYNKANGLHLSRSKRQIKISDIDVEKMTQMDIKDIKVLYIFHKKRQINQTKFVPQDCVLLLLF